MEKRCVSIIIPTYNNARYLRKCIRSVINQTYRNIQIIIVNDGSSDATGEVCDNYARLDERIEVYHLQNKGVSCSRNYALKRVKGDYIQFVDSDDKIKPDMTQTLVRCMEENNVDMVVTNYSKVLNKICIPNSILERKGKYSNREYLQNTLKDPGHHYYGVVWNKLYKADIIKKAGLLFDEEVNLGEDFIFNLMYWQKSHSVYVTSKYLYYYNRTNEITLSNKRHPSLEDCMNELKNRKIIFQNYVRVFQECNLYSENIEKIYRYWIVFWARQQFNIRNRYYKWPAGDLERLKKVMHADENIRKSFKIETKSWIRNYTIKFHLIYSLKMKLKEIWGMICG